MTRSQELLSQVVSAVRDLTERLDRVERVSEKMELILLVREPSSVPAAEAYEGLRRQVVAMRTERTAHLNQLVEFDAALRDGADQGTLQSMVDSWVAAAGLSRVNAFDDDSERFTVLDDQGGEPEIIAPAYVDSASGQTIRPGRVRFMSRPLPESEDEAPSRVASTEGEET
jgi:hypothetical protein